MDKIAEIRKSAEEARKTDRSWVDGQDYADDVEFLLDELEQTRKESNMLREELHKFQELAIKAANHHKAERDEARSKAEEAWKEIDSLEEQLLSSQQEIERLREERDKLIEGLRWYADYGNWFPDKLGDGYIGDHGEYARNILKEIGVTVE